jgi:hypothetical protein
MLTCALAALPAAAVPSVPAIANPDAALFALEEKCVAARAHSQEVGKRWTCVEETMAEWSRSNPEPTWPAANPEAEKLVLQVLKFVQGGGSPSDFVAELATPLTTDASKRSFREQVEAIERRQAWEAKERAAKADCRFDEIEAEWNASTAAVCRLLEEAADFCATTLDGLKCKARLNDIEVDMGHEVVCASIVDDLLAMNAAR